MLYDDISYYRHEMILYLNRIDKQDSYDFVKLEEQIIENRSRTAGRYLRRTGIT